MTPTPDEPGGQGRAAAIKDGDRISDLLDELSRGRLWLPLPDDGGPVTDGSAGQLPAGVHPGSEFLPAVTSGELTAGGYLGSEFVPAFTSAELLTRHGGTPARDPNGPNGPNGATVPDFSA